MMLMMMVSSVMNPPLYNSQMHLQDVYSAGVIGKVYTIVQTMSTNLIFTLFKTVLFFTFSVSAVPGL